LVSVRSLTWPLETTLRLVLGSRPHCRSIALAAFFVLRLQREVVTMPAREAVRRMREMYALVPQVRELAKLPVEIDEAIVEEEPAVVLAAQGAISQEQAEGIRERLAGAPAE